MSEINSSLTASQRADTIDLLNHALADTYLLLFKTKKYHRDIIGCQLATLRQLWEEQYFALSANIDLIAARIRLLGGRPISTLAGYLQLFPMSEHSDGILTSGDIVARLIEDRQQIVQNLDIYASVCNRIDRDGETTDFLTSSIEEYERMAWLLRLFIEGESTTADVDDYRRYEEISSNWIFKVDYENC